MKWYLVRVAPESMGTKKVTICYAGMIMKVGSS